MIDIKVFKAIFNYFLNFIKQEVRSYIALKCTQSIKHTYHRLIDGLH